LSSLVRADAVVLPSDLPADSAALHGKLLWRMRRQTTTSEAPGPAVVFCGIARPEQFFEQVRSIGVVPAAEIAFRDHHAYTASDIKRLLEAKARHSAAGFVTTEKDAVNLGPLGTELNPFAVAALTVTLDNPADIVDTILRRTGVAGLGS
jgi:tetraacyldisaccharide 4'-kinase